MDYYYLLGKNKKPKGPYKLSRLHELWEAGEIPAGTRCCMKGGENWLPIESLAEFFSDFPVTADAVANQGHGGKASPEFTN